MGELHEDPIFRMLKAIREYDSLFSDEFLLDRKTPIKDALTRATPGTDPSEAMKVHIDYFTGVLPLTDEVLRPVVVDDPVEESVSGLGSIIWKQVGWTKDPLFWVFLTCQ